MKTEQWSEVVKEAFRISLALLLSIFAYHYFKIERGYWCILTVLVVYSVPISGLAMRRAKDRIIGTVLGILGAYLYSHLLLNYDYHFVYLLPVLMIPMMFYITIKDHYIIGAFLLSVILIVFISIVSNESSDISQLMFERIFYTGLGVLIVIMCEMIIFPKTSQVGNKIDNLRLEFASIYQEILSKSTLMLIEKNYDGQRLMPHYIKFIKDYHQIKEMYYAQIYEFRYSQESNIRYKAFFEKVDSLIPLISIHISITRALKDIRIPKEELELLKNAINVVCKAITEYIYCMRVPQGLLDSIDDLNQSPISNRSQALQLVLPNLTKVIKRLAV